MKTWNLGYEKSKERARATYKQIGSIQCPALNGEYISCTAVGFSHLVRKGKNPRSKNEQKRRFVLIQYVEEIIKNSKTTIEYRQNTEKININRHGENILIESKAEFWTFSQKVDDCVVKVVIRQLTPGGPKHFFSVMGDNITIANGRRKTKKSRH